jgi:hypothetical protein
MNLHAVNQPRGELPPDFDMLLLTWDITPEVFVCGNFVGVPNAVPLGPDTCSCLWAGAGLTKTLIREAIGVWGSALTSVTWRRG